MRNLEGVIIDMEGVLIDGAAILRQSYVSCLTAYGVPYTEADHRQYVGQTDRHIFNDLKTRFPTLITPLPMLAKSRNEHYERLLATKATPLPGALDFIKAVGAQGIPLALASFASKVQINGLLQSFNIPAAFKVIVSNEMITRAKPEPDIYKLSIHYLGVKSDACVVLESSEVGIEAAATAGARTIAIPTPSNQFNDFSLADAQIPSLQGVDLEELMGEVALTLPQII